MIEIKSTVDYQARQIPAEFQPATILVTASPAVGKEAVWEQALGDLIRASLTFPGHLGTTVLKPESPTTRTYRIITKWDRNETMLRWRDSDERRERVARLSTLEAQPADIQHVTGLETWFDLTHHGEPHAIVPPPKYKMATIVWLAVYFAVVPMINVLRAATADLPPMISSAIGVTASVVLMTWIVMPVLSWMFRFWLYSPPAAPVGHGPTYGRIE
jgi:antibiotic biosynthesis monooxygenase (ABM) superfamily enzyme